jgi:serine/threonine protein kinase
MPAPATGNEFLDVVRESGVVDGERLDAFLEQFSAASPLPDNPQELARNMLEKQLITPFQKEQLLQGKRRGYIIADRYVVLDHLGAGGMGSVYLVEHKVMNRRMAIKVLPTSSVQDEVLLQRFYREGRAVAAVHHPNIVQSYDLDKDGELHFLVMEYVEGTNLHDLVTRDGPLDPQKAAHYIYQAASGLQHAHEAGLVHRDIKPDNIMVDRTGTVKILDMGLALFTYERERFTQLDMAHSSHDRGGITHASTMLGTPDYLAPEQALDSHAADTRADIYSLGATFYFLLTGAPPFGSGTLEQKIIRHQFHPTPSVRENRPDVPEGLAAIIARMLAKNPGDRYQAPGQVLEALTPWVRGTAEETSAGSTAAPEGAPPAAEKVIPAAPTATSQQGSILNQPMSPPAAKQVRLSDEQPGAQALSMQGSGRQEQPPTDPHRALRSPWLRAAGILLLLTLGYLGFHNALGSPGARGQFVWWIGGPILLGIFGAMVLAVIGLQDLSRQDAQHRPSLPLPGTTDLTHRWGRRFFRGAATLAALCCILSVGLALASGLPVLLGVAMGVGLLALIAVVTGTLYLLVVGPRVAYFRLARIPGRGVFSLPGREVQAQMSVPRQADATTVPETASAQVQAAPTTRPGTHGKGEEKPENKLEGTCWRIVAMKYGAAKGFTPWPKGWVSRRVFTKTHLIWVDYNEKTGKLNKSAGGTYALEGDTFRHKVLFVSDKDLEHVLNHEQVLTIKFEGNKLYLSGKFSSGGKMEEIWERVE